ncbi:TonB-dependent siderophore receptor [Methylobacterium sp. J-088]|uniref:TonB-dependent receptor n=1 Tax=Methylobacterium sp. J-088 TaxID=2836664 RepID=UPI001FBB6378|nr:TonB-dependent siderophore receptor [Methylobacterium sp. J-088]MCJ2062742.1 TonB-dependent siderophore receptor [Methylobacterium sp. J-088]
MTIKLYRTVFSSLVAAVFVHGIGLAQAAGPDVTLDELSVEGTSAPRGLVPAYAGGQVAQGGRLGLLGNVDAQKAPFSIASYTDTLIRDRQARTVNEALVLDPSVRATQSTGAPFDSFSVRGFPANENTSGEVAFDGLYGIAPSFRFFSDDAERIEVLKGPSAALTGVSPNGAVGGVVNVVPKRAGEDLTRVTLDYSSAARGGSQLDTARRWGAGREWGARIVGSLHGGDTPFDHQSETTGVGALALDYQGERFRAWLYLLAQTDRFDAPLRPFQLKAGVPVPRAPAGRLNLTQPWECSDIDDRGGLLRTEYDLTDHLTLFADLGGARTGVERYFQSAPTILNLRGDMTSTPQFYGLSVDRLTVDGGLRARFETGFVHHAVTVQTSTYAEETGRWFSAGRGAYLSNLYAPRHIAYIAPIYGAGRPRYSDSTLSAVSVADTLSALDERVLLTLGVRRQRVEAHNYVSNVGALASSYDKGAATPVVGLVIRPWEAVSLYGNSVEGLSRGDVAPLVAKNSGEILTPYVARQVEAGVKIDLGGIGATLGAFRITKPSGELGPQNRAAATGAQRVSGLELNLFGTITPQLRVLGGVTQLDGVLTRTALAANLGHRPIGVPTVQASLGAEWDLPGPPGLTLDGAVIYTSRQFVDLANTQALPDWARLDLGLRYATVIGDRRTTFRAAVQNVTGANYWTGVATFGTFFQSAPRTYLLSMAVDL